MMESQRSYISILFFTALLFLSSISFVSAATIYTNSSTGNDSTGDGSSGAPYATFHKAYTIASAGDTIDLTGTFTWTNAGETGDVATTGYTLGKNLTIIGQSSNQTYLQAASASTTADRRVFTISSGVVVTMSEVNIRHGRITSTSYYGGGISNSGTLTITDSEINNNYAGGGGGGIDNVGTTTAQRISVYNNTVSYMGGGLLNNYNIVAGGYFVVENSTIYGNRQTSTSGYLNGGGVHVRGGEMSLTNVSIVGNTAAGGGGLGMETTGGVYLKNTLIAGNTSSTYGASYNDLRKSSGTIYDNGYNIIGRTGGTSFTGTGDWTDTDGDGIYTLYSVGTTGSLNLDTGTSVNDNATSTPTWALLASSIAINNGSTGSNGATSTVPTLDQRGATRSGATDIGAFEYGGTGLTISAPSTQASAVSFSSVEYYGMTLSWTVGSGSRRVVFMKEASSGTASPVDSTAYTASSVFGSGMQIGSSGWYAVYEGLGSSVAVTGLTGATTYIVQVFEYNGVTSGTQKYQTATASNNPNTQASHTITTLYVNSSSGNDSTGNGSSGSPYKTFHKGYTTASAGDTLNLTGTFTWTDADETGDVVTSGYTIGKELIIQGQRANTTIIQTATASTTGDRRVFTTSSGTIVTFNDITIQNGRVTSGSTPGGGIYSQGTTTVQRSLVTNNYVNGYGGGIAQQDSTNGGSLTVIDSTISYNTGVSQGGGLWSGTNTTGAMNITNSTIVFNTQQASVATVGGGGVAYRSGNGSVTNSTISYNNIQNGGTANGAGLWFSPDTSYTVQLKNNIIASNYKSGVALTGSFYDIYKGSSGTYTDNGANILGKYSSSNITVATSTWVDLQGSVGAGDGTFTKSNGGSGSLYLDTALADNASTNYTQTLAITDAAGITVNYGYTGTNGSISVPTRDQRGGTRSGATDIGAYEYGGVGLDSTVPTVSLTLPTDGATIYGNAIGMSASASDDTAVVGVKFYVNNILVGSEDTSSPYAIVWNSLTATTSGSKIVVAVARDSAGNVATSSARTVTLSNQPAPSSVTASTSVSAATITWATPVEGSSRMYFGFVNGLASSTPEQNTSTKVTSHSVDLAGLPSCAVFKYYTVSKNEANEIATSTQSTFKTAGCSGGATITANSEDDITAVSGGTLTEGSLSLTVPASFTATSSQATFQAKKLDGSTFFSNVTGPSGKNRAGTIVYNLSAYTDTSTTLSTFVEPLTVTLSYTDGDVSGLDESTLKIHRYDSSSWSELSSCSVDTSANTISCTTTQFSDFGIFGDTSSSSSSSSSSGGGGVVMGCTDRRALNYSQYAFGTNTASCQYAQTSTTNFPPTISHSSTTPLSFTRNLSRGMSGDDVRALQVFLMSKGYGSLTDATGYFGSQTQDALAVFQEENGISPAIGYFGPKTRILVSGAGQVAVETSVQSTETPLSFNRDLRRGDTGEDVYALQEFLIRKKAGPAAQALRAEGATRFFGTLTKNALIEFQQANDIFPAVGYFGQKTRTFFESLGI